MTTTHSEEALKALMLLSLDGDEAAYRRLLTALRVLLVGYYSRRMAAATRADMEDLVQETLLALHSRRSTYDRNRSFTAWFFSIARYKLIDHHRGRGGRRLAETELDDQIESDFSEDRLTARMDVERLLDGLPLRQQELIRQVKLEGSSVADAANRTGQSESAVKVSIHRALKVIGERLRGTS
ncbi:RNA polymerase subunit sigma-70 [Rhizobium esperanzae]|uniref:RNA polymerase subunit sigma-70 n=1 Tax=Rhizobium esperanzae TaxID=1967781 RepID=A0A246DX39_9HYPH|nr:sigma-70 family RNA polymerase sigma factor [Rhizobium esperanzae]OWO94871.1 RNA polymerase subunit sigma-70 [Rhizobium esperanzae]